MILKINRRYIVAVAVILTAAATHAQYAPPAGGEDFFDFLSPYSVGRGATVTSDESPTADALNPAASGLSQRVTLDIGYAALAGLGETVTGVGGHVLNLGGILPTRAGVVTSSLHYLTSDYDEVELGSTFGLNLSFAKALYPNLLIGIGGNLYLGGAAGTVETGVTADIGLLHVPGRSYGLRNLRVALVLQELGKWYRPIPGRSGLPSPFTPRAGIAFDPVDTDEVHVGVYADAALPTFRNLRVSLGGVATFQDVFSIYGGFRLDARQLIDPSIANRSLIPSFGISVNFDTNFQDESSFIGRQGWNRSEVRTRAAAAPLYGGVWALSTGANIPLGVVDSAPPEIAVDYEDVVYISPNNDGISDDVSLDVSIRDQRYLQGFEFRIEDSQGHVVRLIENKEERPETEGFQNVLDRLFAVETGIEAPDRLRWDGTADTGGVVEDGDYRMFVSAWDDNGNQAEVGPFDVVVDATPPTVTVRPIPRTERIFSPNNDGIKDQVVIEQTGSRELLWSAWIEDANGETVYERRWTDSAPATIAWEGRNNQGELLADGIYGYTVTSTDEAGNSTTASIGNIIINNQSTPITLTIDSSVFSPNGDGTADFVTLFPDVPVTDGIISWNVRVRTDEGRIVRTIEDSGTPPAKISFAGRTESGARLPEGPYYADMTVTYENGNRPQAQSPPFVVDLTPPDAAVTADTAVFSPNGDGNLDAVTFFQEASTEQRWSGTITGPNGEEVRSYEWLQQPDPRHVWSGQDERGRPVPDGEYTYVLRATDAAGNRFVSSPVTVRKDTSETAVILTAEYDVFSPNADGNRDRLRLFPQVDSDARVVGYEIEVHTDSGEAVRSYSGRSAMPESIVWDGKDDSGRWVGDGAYRAHITAEFANGNREEGRSAPILVDTQFPDVTVRTPFEIFSPDGDGRRDEIQFTQSSSSEALWEGHIRGTDGTVVRSYYWKGAAQSFTWDGTDEAGNVVTDGFYTYEISATDAAGNSAAARIDGIVVDSRQTTVFVTANRESFSPNGDDVLERLELQAYTNLVDGATRWELAILSETGRVVRVFNGSDVLASRTIEWDGTDSVGQVVDGVYRARFTVEYEKGNRPVESSGSFTVDTAPPEVNLTLAPVPFSPDNDGVNDELAISIDVQDSSPIRAWRFEILDRNDRFFHQFAGRGDPAREIIWDGRSSDGELVISAESYPYRFTISDDVGNITQTSGTIPIDILVVRDGDRLKVQIADITFQPNSPRLVTDPTTRQGARNRAILLRLAEVFDRYSTYRIRIEGHAVNITGTEREEREELRPLSLARAQEVQDALVELGMNPRRISVLGRGGTDPVVPHTDTENRWKNRRVEFILLR